MTSTQEIERATPRGRAHFRRWHVGPLLLVAVFGLGSCTVLNPVLTFGINSSMESRCTSKYGFTYDRESWTPLRWSCTNYYEDGSSETLGFFDLIF